MMKIRLLLLYLLVLASSCLMAQTAGYTKVNVSVGDNGEAIASIPLNLPKGTILQPNLSLSYSSQGNNGLQGVGFSLSGIFQTITRIPATLAQDGQLDPVDFNSLDRFALNGERLVVISGLYGADGSEYRTEQNSFAKIIASGTGTFGPDKFTVYTKDGLILYFGNTADSRIEASGTTDKPLLWLLNRIEDKKGNYITLTYIEENADGSFRPDEINYTGNSITGLLPYNKIQFVYENSQESSINWGFRYLSGYKTRFTKRLKEIKILDHQTVYRWYFLEYDNAGNVKLKKVQEYASNDQNSLLEVGTTEFTWSTSSYTDGFNKIGSGDWAIPTVSNTKIGDFNGDGKTDFIGKNSNGIFGKVCLSTGNHFDCSDWTIPNFNTNYVFTGDFNGDGHTDVGYFDPVSRQISISVVNPLLKKFSTTVWYTSVINSAETFYFPLVGDYNGDGRSDLFINIKSSLPANYPDRGLILNSTGTSFSVNQTIYFESGEFANAGDLNGDGRTDLFTLVRKSLAGNPDIYDWKVYVSTGSSFNKEIWFSYFAFNSSTSRLGDVNGDGLADLIRPAPANSSQWYVNFNTGKSFNLETNITGPYNESTNYIKAFPIDIDSDGKTDLFGFNSTNKWQATLHLQTNWPFLNGPDVSTTDPVWGDFDGNGINDIALKAPTNTSWSVNLSTFKKEFVTQIKNGHGAIFKFNYAPLTDTTVYTKGTNATYPDMDFQGAFHVVSKLTVDNGIGGFHDTHYKYGGATLNHWGRGYRGFSQRTIIDSTAKQYTVNTYNRDFRYLNASLIKSEQRSFNGKLIHVVENTPAVTNTNSTTAVYFSYYQRAKSSQYEQNGVVYRSKQTDFVFDANGNTTTITETDNDGYQVVTNNTYTDNLPAWRLGRLTATTVTKTRTGFPSVTKNSTFGYDNDGHLIQEILLPGNARRLQKDYVLDAYGNTLSLTTSGPDITSRTESSVYDAEGRNVLSVKNALNHTTTFTYNRGFIASTTDPNGLTTRVTRDFMGRETLTTHSDGTTHSIAYKLCAGYVGCPVLAVHYTEEQSTGSGIVRTYFDKLDRVIRTEKQGFDGSNILTDTQYNTIGLVTAQSDPYYAGTTSQWTTTEYDTLQRPVKVIQPGNRITKSSYSTYSYGSYSVQLIKISNPQNQRKEQAISPQGKVIFTKDHYGNLLSNGYDSDLNLLRVSHAAGNQIQAVYDIRGFKTLMQDLDMGPYSYAYNTLGLLTSQTNPKGQTSTIEYDKLNRITRRIEPEGTTLYEYDDATTGIGKPSRVKFNNQIIEEYTYDAKGRPSKTTYNRETKSYQIQLSYNTATGFLETKTYPNGLTIKYVYNTYGYLKEVRNNDASNKLYWKANTLNARDMITSAEVGNGLTTQKTYDSQTWYLTNIRTVNGQGSVQNDSYSFSPIGNLVSREDELYRTVSLTGVSHFKREVFDYDSLNRVKQVVTQMTAKNYSNTLSLNYDFLGNITYKSDVGTYNYGENGVGPHVLSSINNVNSTSACAFPFNQTIQYTSYNYVSLLANNRGDSVKLSYGPNRERILQTLIKGRKESWKKHYVGGIFEKLYYPNSASDFLEVCYIEAAGQVIAYVEKTSRNTTTTRYLHTDHLGSATVITKEDGTVDKRYSYDAWGRQRDPDTWKNYAAPPDLPTNQRGFTFHEMLDIDWLICMNARVYDPITGRFLSADPTVQFPDDLQSYNRYAYVLNNPLSFTDPTGFDVFDDIISIAVSVAIIAIAINTGGFGLVSALGASGTTAAVIAGAVGGFGAAFVNTIINGGNLGDAFRNGLVGGFWGGITAGVTYGIAHAGGGLFGDGGILEKYQMYKPIAHGIAQGTISVLRGGDFKSQFMAGLISSYAGDMSKGMGIESKMVIGGVASKLSGGNFVNGAVTAAFIDLFNDKSGQLKKMAKTAEEIYIKLNEINELSKEGMEIARGFNEIAHNRLDEGQKIFEDFLKKKAGDIPSHLESIISKAHGGGLMGGLFGKYYFWLGQETIKGLNEAAIKTYNAAMSPRATRYTRENYLTECIENNNCHN